MPDENRTSRRSFFQLGAGAALFCTIGGEEVDLAQPGTGKQADALAARVAHPPAAARTAQELPRPEPAPGGVRREYWVQARSTGWNIVPTGRDDWHGRKIPGKTSFRAYVYQEMTAGFADRDRPLHRGQPRPLALPLPRLLPSGRGDDGFLRRRVTVRARR